MRLFAIPSGFEGRGKRLESGVGRQGGGVVVLLPGRTPFADQPDLFFAGHGLHAPVRPAMPVTLGNPNTGCGELATQLAFGAPPPAELLPFLSGQHGFCGNGHAGSGM